MPTPVEQRPTERTLTEQRTTGRTPRDDIRHRLFSDSMQRQLFARHVPQRPPKASPQGTPSGLDTTPATAPQQTVFAGAIDTKIQPNSAAAVVDLTTGVDDATQQEVTGEPSAPNPVEERLSETTVHTPSISEPEASRSNRLASQARLARLQEEKFRVAKEHKEALDKLNELDNKRRVIETEIDQTQAELIEGEEEASNRSLSTSVKSSRKSVESRAGKNRGTAAFRMYAHWFTLEVLICCNYKNAFSVRCSLESRTANYHPH